MQQSLRVSDTRAISIGSAALGLFVAVSLAALSVLEHRNTLRPSFLIWSYLICTLLFDIARVRTSFLRSNAQALAGTATASVVLKVAVLILETVNKRSILLDTYSRFSSEATSSLPSRGLFLWLASLLRQGSKKILTLKDLLPIHEKLDPRKLTIELSATWSKSDQHRRHGLAMATLWAWRGEFAKIALPRLMLVALNLIQPFVIQAVVENNIAPDSPEIRNQGYGLIGAVGLIYLAQAIVTGFYEHLALRLTSMIRGGLVGMIYRKLTRSPAGAAEAKDSAVITLVESDVERISETWYLIVSEVWPSILQLGFAVWLLERQLGAVCVAPVIMALAFTLLSFSVARFITERQRLWLEAVQRRVNFTTNVLSHMKNVKMLGLGDKMQQLIRNFRDAEIVRSKKFRTLSSLNICIMNLPDSIGSFVTFGAFALAAKIQNKDAFTVSQAIGSLSILAVLMEPLQQLLFCIPQIFGALGCFERIQKYLNSESWDDNRQQRQVPGGDTGPSHNHRNSDIELQTLQRNHNGESIVVRNATFGWPNAAPILHDIDLRLDKDTNVTIVTGPVGCGKSSLLKSLLGETVLQGGTVSISSDDVSYCDQVPWLPTGTVQSIIVGASEYCERLYKTVVHACALDIDFRSFEHGDQTRVRSQGSTLSGGQKQRLSMARALFSKKRIAVFDDVLSGLDPVTREIVMTRVFGRDGLVRELGIIAILATHITNRLDLADNVVVLDGEGRIEKQGPPDAVGVTSLPDFGHGSAEAEEQQQAAELAEEAAMDQKNRQTGDVSVYKFYFRSLGWGNFALFAFIVCLESACNTMESAWISLWSSSADSNNTGYWLGLYGMWIAGKTIGLFAACFFIYVVTVPLSARHLHATVLETAFRAPMSFITPTPTGVLVNRFSQDMRLIDMVLPGNLVSTSFILTGCIGAGALTIVASPYLACVFPFLLAAMYFLQRFYLRTSRQLRLLELEAKAPLLSHVIDTIRGMVSIRAYGWEEEFAERCEELMAQCQKPYYLLECIQQWLGMVLGLMVGVLAVLLTTVSVTLRGNHTSAGFVGVALVGMMRLGQMLARLIVTWTGLETSLGAVSRIKNFKEETPREPEPDGEVDAEWPSTGAVSFDNWTAGYGE